MAVVELDRWINAIAGIITMIICGFIILNDIIRRNMPNLRRKHNNNRNENNEKYRKCLNFFSMITMSICLIKSITTLLFQFEYSWCRYINPKTDIPIIAMKISFTFYQITRFIYLFIDSINNNNSIRIYYYYLLYLIGFLILLSALITRVYFVEIKPSSNNSDNNDDVSCIFISKQTIYGVIVFITYYIWDLYILYLFNKKLKNLRQTTAETDKIRKLTKFLHKLIFLIILWELISFICICIPYASLAFIENSAKYFLFLMINIEIISTIFIQFLIIEDNDKIYNKICKLFRNCKICCLCHTQFVYRSLNNENIIMTRNNTIELQTNSDQNSKYTNLRIQLSFALSNNQFCDPNFTYRLSKNIS